MTDVLWAASMPEIYDRCLGPVLFTPFADALAERAVLFAPRTVLELGAGSGRVTAALVRALPNAAVTATDLNPAMVEFGAARVPDARWQQADAQELGFAAASIDLVVSGFTVMFLPDRVAAYREVGRVLADGGRFLFSSWGTLDTSPLTAAVVRAVATVLPDDTPDFVTRIPHGYTDRDRIRADLTAAGFGDVEIEPVTLTTHADSARQLAEGFCLGSPLRFALQERGEPTELAAAIATETSRLLGAGEISAPMAANVVTASAFS